MSKKKKDNAIPVTITTDNGTAFDLDLATASEVVKGLYTRALELKQGQVQLETRLVENNILINDYINKIVELVSEGTPLPKEGEEDVEGSDK